MWEMAYGRGTHPLRRLVARRVAISAADEVLVDANAMEAHRAAAAAVTSATGGAIVFELGGSALATIVTAVDPTDHGLGDNACVAYARYDVDGVTITGGRIVCRSLYWAGRAPVLIHELLHVVGLDHSSREGDVMCTCSHDPNRTISGRETQVVREMLRLAPGTAPGGSR